MPVNNNLHSLGFVWWVGVVENRNDPDMLGRCQVRIIGFHTEDKTQLPTEDLPWAYPMLPVTSASISGIGQSPVGPVEGTFVIGFFRDGESAQEPIMLGSVGGVPIEKIPDSEGFSDPKGVYPKFFNEPDTNRLARHDSKINSDTIVIKKEGSRITGVPIANGGSWNQVTIPYNSKYPFNHVYQSESGHVLEFDDTSGSERIHKYHRAGTFEEIDENGTRVNRIVGDNYEIVERNGFVYIKGKCNVTVDGTANILVNSNANIEVKGDVIGTFRNDVDFQVSGEFNVTAGGNINLQSDANIHLDTPNGEIHWNSGRTGLPSPAGRASVSETEFQQLEPNGRGEAAALEIFDEDFNPEKAIELIKSGVLKAEEVNKVEKADKPVDEEKGSPKNVVASCDLFKNQTNFPDSFPLSANINLGMLSSNAPAQRHTVAAQKGLTKAEIVCNLKGVAENICEPIIAKYGKGNVLFTSGFRLEAAATGTSQHPTGQAVDMQFPSLSKMDYFERAREIRTLLSNFDQLLLEYKTTGTGKPWIHISFKYSGNRGQVLTLFNGRTAAQGLTQMGDK